MTKEQYYLWLGITNGISNSVKKKLLDFFGDAEALWNADRNVLKRLLNEQQMQRLMKTHNREDVETYGRNLEKNHVSLLYIGHPYYPEKLLSIPDAPVTLFVRGSHMELLSGETKSLAVVGARNLSPYGKQTVEEIIRGLLPYDIVIISGMAAGIDGAAHQEVLAGGGKTVAVLGSGINVPYPEEHKLLYRAISEQGLILSEYGLNLRPEAWYFPLRNRIISGLSDAVLVIEAKKKSGSLITADQALEQGRDVGAVPGRIYDVNSIGCNNLIKNGAACITSADDLVDLLRLDQKIVRGKCKKITLAPEEKMVYSCVRLEPRHIDDICRELDLRVSDILGVLFDLEQKGMIKQPVRNHFVRT